MKNEITQLYSLFPSKMKQNRVVANGCSELEKRTASSFDIVRPYTHSAPEQLDSCGCLFTSSKGSSPKELKTKRGINPFAFALLSTSPICKLSKDSHLDRPHPFAFYYCKGRSPLNGFLAHFHPFVSPLVPNKPNSATQGVRVTSEEVDEDDLTGYRLIILKSAAENLLQAGGYHLEDAEDNWIHFTTKSSERGTEAKKILCGPVVNSVTKLKETEITLEDYRKLRAEDLKTRSEDKGDMDGHLLESLLDGSIKVGLLQVKGNQAVSLNLNLRETGSRGGTFIQYNASRLGALRERYKELSDGGIYPEIATPEDVDFGVLNEPEEWGLVFNFLVEYPSMIYRISREIVSGKSNIHQLCDFLSKLSSLFSVYYRRVRILLEPRDHLFQTVQARMLLAMSVEQVLENGLAILNIKKVERM